MDSQPHHTVVIIGTGFGGTMTGLALARDFDVRNKKETDPSKKKTILMLERGTWWTTPVGTVQDKEAKTADFLRDKTQPVQYWPAIEHFKGFIDIFLRCVRRKNNEDGLYDMTTFGKRGFLGLFGGKNDGVTIVRASGVGGGSLVYSNVTIQPPDLIFEDPAWPTTWTRDERNQWFEKARDAIGFGVLYALETRKPSGVPDPNKLKINTGLSNISARTARLDPHWDTRTDASSGRQVKQIHLSTAAPGGRDTFDPHLDVNSPNRLWIDRARVFQTTMAGLTKDFGTVDSAINDLPPENTGKPVDPKNYCERQGRCNVGCLPGARHTLNKQLMAAILGNPQGAEGTFKGLLSLEALAEVDVIQALSGGGYSVRYWVRDPEDPSKKTMKSVTADKVIVSAGCVGTNEIMLRSKDRKTLPDLSDRVGFNFSTNGDYLAFVEDTRERVSLTRGPVTTSFAHFNTPGSSLDGGPADPSKFHTVEDNGIPRALASTAGFGVPLIRSLSKGRGIRLFIIWSLILWVLSRPIRFFRAIRNNYRERDEFFKSEDEFSNNIMAVAAMGREGAQGRFTLGGGMGETPLRLSRLDGLKFYEDPIYAEIRSTLKTFAEKLTGATDRDFINPFLSQVADTLQATSIGLTHPLGGCRIAKDAEGGVTDEYGRVFQKGKTGSRPFYEGLYIADASIIPTALGVNPSLTISALSLRIADKIIEETP